ncbi:MAG TPA: aminotransferase class I/II-fold pyridoxal phosphate-dependent enzyme [Jatrophihabitans sp.]|nr:aminotransferase class I/II-fold pyridoxal phosphate-dependent enzyme [Jatrophihabitans sp.]
MTTRLSVDPQAWLAATAAERAAAGLRRRLSHRQPDSSVLDLASNDYLGLCRDPRLSRAAARAADEWGAGASGSRLVTGSTALHAELEAELAALVGAPAGLVFSSGYLANLGAVTALAGPDCLVVSDAGNHASLVDACRLSRSTVLVSPAGDPASIENALANREQSRAVVVVDAVGSASGELAPLAELAAIADRHGALLVVDDAHGLGVRGGGRGAAAEAGITGHPNVLTTVTLSKALGAQGGAVLAGQPVIEHLIDTARSFIFDTGLNPPAVGAALAAVRIIAAEPELAAAALDRAAELAGSCGVPTTGSAVVPVPVGEAQAAYDRSLALLDKGIRVGCFRPPSVPAGSARLRLIGRANLTGAELDRFRRAWASLP